jgi:hypothetical protein
LAEGEIAMKLTVEQLSESIKQVNSIISKINAINKSKLPKSQRTLIERRLEALLISLQLLEERHRLISDAKDKDIIRILGEQNLENAQRSRPYQSIVFCVIDAIFSIRAKYHQSTLKVLDRTAKALGLASRHEEYEVSVFLSEYKDTSSEVLAKKVFQNSQRTSSVNGILKAEAVIQAMVMLQGHGIETIKDFNDSSAKSTIESEWRKIRGQSSGVTWRYLLMLAGNPDMFKDDSHIYRFFIEKLGYPITFGNDYEKLKDAFMDEHEKVTRKYPNMTVSVLDHIIWSHMSQRQNRIEL